MNNNATLRDENILSLFSLNNLIVPEIQREYVWNTTQIETLFDSLIQDYPIDAFLFWNVCKEKKITMIFMSF